MNLPDTPRRMPPEAEFEFRLQALLDLKREMQALHARLEFIRLMLKFGVRLG
jgi:hypothetical protein